MTNQTEPGSAKFTKKPWTAELGEIHEVRDSEGGRICILTQLRGRHGLGGRRPDGESAANAKLIACAPEMAEMLLEVRKFFAGSAQMEIDLILKKAGIL